MNEEELMKAFEDKNGVLKTSELNQMGLSSRQIKKLLDQKYIRKIKYGYYEPYDTGFSDEALIMKLFPNAVIFLESALMHYGYTDRIPNEWQIAVDRNSNKKQYDIEYPMIKPFFLEPKYMDVGRSSIIVDNVEVRIFDRERTICDVLRYKNKIEDEVFRNAVTRYLQDDKKNLRKLFEFAAVFDIKRRFIPI